jgi:hypothetical protein
VDDPGVGVTMTDTADIFRVAPDPAAVRRREMRKQIEEAVAADERPQSAREHLAALKRERVPAQARVERLRAHGHVIYLAQDTTGLAPPPGLVVAGRFKDLIPSAKADLESLDAQIAEAERAVDDLDP